MSETRNYIADRNLFSLPKPPAWWLGALERFDRDLVVIPSRMRPVYWICRRLKLTLAFSGKPMDNVDPRPDTQMFITHKIVNVVDITNRSNWSEQSLHDVLDWLANRDTWAEEGGPLDEAGIRTALANGGSKVTKRVEYEDALRAERVQISQRETIYHATGDAYRSLQARLGRTIRNVGSPADAPAPSITSTGA